MRTLRSEVDIEAPPPRVWGALTDFRSFPSWNPFIRRADGAVVPGCRIHITLRLGARLVTFHPRLTVVDEPRELRWLARQRVPGLFDVERRFLLEPVDPARCRFMQSETASGLLAPLVMPLLRRRILRGYREMDAALKSRVEKTG
ncbi:MAG TPA: SRPBCC domain-containing protein [Micromonosporaceae bacterium]|nr:SRPBCC domain-containing protein [Micromonosporaceae bacterium]